jgi:F5/8 type C domain/Ricin-type beta-trefoil lectin domain
MLPDRNEPPYAGGLPHAGGPPGHHGHRSPRTSWPERARAATTALILLAGCLVTVVAAAVTGAPAAKADTVPPAPSGWTTVFGDNFAGAANSAPAASNWFYDIGTGYGTGESEQTTNSTSNVYLDGSGHLVLKATDSNGTWTSGRIESTRDDFQAPPGGKLEMTASIEQPNPANGLGYWPAFWALGSPMRTGGGWPTSGEIDMMEDVNGLNEASQTLHDASNSPGHALTACPGAGSSCQTGYHTYSVIVDRTNTSAETLQFLMDGTVESTITEASVGTTAWQEAIDHGFFIIFDLAMGGNYPDGECNCTTPTSATSSGASMSVGYVAVYEQGGNSTPTGTASATGQLTAAGGQCLTNQNSLNTAGNPIVVSGCNNGAGQQWSPYTDGTLRTQGGCLDVVSAGTTSGTDVDWYPCNGTAAQGWKPQSNGELVNPSSGLCLTDPGGNTSARLDIETCTGATDQQWTLPTGSGSGGPPPSSCGTTNLALNKTATASSLESAAFPASNAVDGNTGTRWSSAFSDPQWLEVDLGSVQSICQVSLDWENAYATAFQLQTSTDGSTWTTVYSTTSGTGGNQTLNVTGSGRYLRMYGTARGTPYGYSLWEFGVYGPSGGGGGGTCGTANAALNKTTTASSLESAAFPASAATDGNLGTRWSSGFSDPQWLEVDLGSSQSICQVVLNWETAYATAFQIQTSTDGSNWTTVYSTTTGTGGNQTLNVTGSGRYIRMYGTARATQYGYSLWEFGVHTA